MKRINISVAVTKSSAWWDGLSAKEQRQYIKDHPTSKYAKQVVKPTAPLPVGANPRLRAPVKNDQDYPVASHEELMDNWIGFDVEERLPRKTDAKTSKVSDKDVMHLNSIQLFDTNGRHEHKLGDAVRAVMDGTHTTDDLTALTQAGRYGTPSATYKRRTAKTQQDPAHVELIDKATKRAKELAPSHLEKETAKYKKNATKILGDLTKNEGALHKAIDAHLDSSGWPAANRQRAKQHLIDKMKSPDPSELHAEGKLSEVVDVAKHLGSDAHERVRNAENEHHGLRRLRQAIKK